LIYIIIKNKETKNGGLIMNGYHLAYEILSEKINFFEIYPRFFLNLIKENNQDIYNKLTNNNLLEEDKEEVELLIDLYYDELCKLRDKSNIICNLVSCNNPLGFFQEMMQDNIELLKTYKLEELKELSFKGLSFDEVILALRLDKNYILKLNQKYI
jgi:hypothetical protein